MNVKEWLFAQENQGSTTCFLLGRLNSEKQLHQFSKYSDVVWFVDQEYVQPKFQLYSNIHISPLESIDKEKLDEIIRLLIQVNPGAIPNIFCGPAILDHHPAAYDFVLQRIHIICEETLRARQTRQEEGFIAQKNILENLPYYVTNRISADLENRLNDIPVAIVGAGPSLDVSITVIKEHCSKFLVFAVDSALPILHNQGITPDATFSIDAEKPASACVQENQSPGALFLSIKSPNDWCEYKDNPIHFLSGNNLTEDWLEEQGISRAGLSALGNCGITAVKTAIHLGCSPILLFGMDHATSDSGEGHAQMVNQNISRGKTHNPASRSTTVPGNYSPRVKTFLLNEWEKLDNLISDLPQHQEVWNINDRGAKFEKAVLLHPDQFHSDLEPLQHRHEIPLRDSQNSQDSYTKLTHSLENILIQLKLEIEGVLEATKPNTQKTLQFLTEIFQHPQLAKLLGSLSFKAIPNLLKWNSLSEEAKMNILEETQSLLKLLQRTPLSSH